MCHYLYFPIWKRKYLHKFGRCGHFSLLSYHWIKAIISQRCKSQLQSNLTLQFVSLSFSYLCMFVLRPAPTPCCPTSTPAPLSSAGLPGSPRWLRVCQCQAALWVTPVSGSPDSRWPAACGAPPVPPWRAAARWWGCISRKCSPWSGSSACDLSAKTTRRGFGTSRTWGSSEAGPGAETPEPPCTGRGTRSHSFCQTQRIIQDAQVHLRRGDAGRECCCPRDEAAMPHAWQDEDKRCWLVVEDPPFSRLTAQICIRLTRTYGDE